MEIVRDTVVVNTGIQRQLVNQLIHIIGFIVNSLDVFIHLFRRVCNAVHNTLHVALDGGNRRL